MVDPFLESEEYQRGYFDALKAAADRDNAIIAEHSNKHSDDNCDDRATRRLKIHQAKSTPPTP